MTVEEARTALCEVLDGAPEIRTAVLFGSVARGMTGPRSDIDVAVARERAVQTSVDIASHLIADSSRPVPDTMGGCFAALEAMGIIEPALALRMQKAVGFRTIAVHEYEEIDWDVVYSIASRNLDDFRASARRILEHCGIGPR